MEDVKKVPFIGKTWVIVLACIFLPPLGIAFIWMKKDLHLNLKIILSALLAFYMLFIFVQVVSTPKVNEPVVAAESQQSADVDYYPYFVQTLQVFVPTAEPGLVDYKDWELDGVIYIQNKYKVDGVQHDFMMRCSKDMTQLFYVAIDGEKVLSDVDAEMKYSSSQAK